MSPSGWPTNKGDARVTRKHSVTYGQPLTTREKQVLICICKEKSAKEAGRELGMSKQGIEFHLTHVYVKLGVKGRTGAAMWAVRNGLV